MTTVDWMPSTTSVHRFHVLTIPGAGPKPMDRFKRKEIVDRFNALAAQIDEIMTDSENERLHDETRDSDQTAGVLVQA